MHLLSFLYSTIVEALFPLSPFEEELFSYSPQRALTVLPKSPSAPVENTSAVYAYKDERVSKLVWNIKYKKSAAAVSIGGYALFNRLKELNLPIGTLIIPMPITIKRRRERGFNQCELLIDEIARLDAEHHFEIRKDLLIRTRHVGRQTLKGRAERLESAKGIFEATDQIKNFSKRTIVVIDDVITTGSTIREAMETIRNAGMSQVRGVALAH